MWMTWWYDPWLGEMELTVGVEQVEVVKETPPEVLLVCWHCEEATHSWTALETRREPEACLTNMSNKINNYSCDHLILEVLFLTTGGENLITIYTFTSYNMSGLHASHADRDHAALLLPRLDFHDSLQKPDVGIIYVAAAVVIHTGRSEAVAEKP